MMRFLRSQSQTVLIVVLAVIGFGFLFYGNAGNLLTSSAGRAHTDFGRIDGQDVSMTQLYDAIRNTHDMLLISGHGKELSQPGVNQEIAQEGWRQLLLLHEADVLNIKITNKQLLDYIQNMPVFQKNGAYSPELYQKMLTNLQNNLHLSPDAFTNLLSNNLRMNAVRTILFSSVRISAQDITSQFEKFEGPVQVSLVTIEPKSFIDSAKVTPEEIEAEYKSHQENPAYRTEEKRKVDYVVFQLTPEQAKLPAKDKDAAMEALGEKALNFALSLQPDPSATTANAPAPDFVAGAKKAGLTTATTDFFAVDTPPSGLPPSPSFNHAAFSLTKDDSISKVVEMENGVAVLHLAGVQPSEVRPLEQVKADIAKILQQNKGRQSQQVSAQIAAQTLQAAMAKGTDFKTAAAGLNLKVETLPAFVPTKPSDKEDPRMRVVAYITTTLPVGGVSEPVPVQSNNSVVIVHLDSRAKADTSGLAKFETQYREQKEQQLQALAYVDWASWTNKRPGTHKPPDLDQYAAE